MKVPNDEDLANHVSPESCGGCGNKTAEALTGENAGGPLSSEITTSRVPTLSLGGEGNIRRSAKRELWRNPAESVEGRALTKRNTVEAAANRTQWRLFASFGWYGVRRRAEQ